MDRAAPSPAAARLSCETRLGVPARPHRKPSVDWPLCGDESSDLRDRDGSSRAGHERPLTGNQLGCQLADPDNRRQALHSRSTPFSIADLKFSDGSLKTAFNRHFLRAFRPPLTGRKDGKDSSRVPVFDDRAQCNIGTEGVRSRWFHRTTRKERMQTTSRFPASVRCWLLFSCCWRSSRLRVAPPHHRSKPRHRIHRRSAPARTQPYPTKSNTARNSPAGWSSSAPSHAQPASTRPRSKSHSTTSTSYHASLNRIGCSPSSGLSRKTNRVAFVARS
jgi:hypothetical protein